MINNENYYPTGASDECKYLLERYGIRVQIEPRRGEHGARIWIPDENKHYFEENILGKSIDGKYRRFWFSKHGGLIDSSKYGFYYVSYQTRK